MDILIKNMEMPRGNNVLVVDSAGTITKVNRWTGKAEATDPLSVKAVALPEHGDLIDADVLDEKIKKLWFIPKQTKTEYMVAVEKTIANAPVIVEATE